MIYENRLQNVDVEKLNINCLVGKVINDPDNCATGFCERYLVFGIRVFCFLCLYITQEKTDGNRILLLDPRILNLTGCKQCRTDRCGET